MRKNPQVLQWLFVFLLEIGSVGFAGEVPLIVTGWDSPTPAQYREGLKAFEEWGLFDGTTIRPTRQTTSGVVDAQNAFGREPWSWDQFAPALKDLQAAKTTTCRETFLMLYSNPGDIDWFDDTGWKNIVQHCRFLARLAKQGGLKGLLFDAEPYSPPAKQYRYQDQASADRYTFDEYRKQARLRGREVMAAILEEFPDVAIFAYRLFSDLLEHLDADDPARAMIGDTYGLLPPFVDGWLDVATERISIIEGTEDIGYRANSQAEYDSAFTVLRLRMREFVAPEHRAKVDRQFRVGQSLYLDAYINPKGDNWHIDHTGSTPSARLTANIQSARSSSDGLVWLYGEQERWWVSSSQNVPLWPERFPGCDLAIQRAVDPVSAAKNAFSKYSESENLIRNANFSNRLASSQDPDHWSFWQEDDSKGEFVSGKGGTGLRGASDAIISQSIPVTPGKTYAVRIRVKQSGQGDVTLNIGWKDADSQWLHQIKQRKFHAVKPVDSDGTSEILGIIEAPAGVGQMVFMPGVNGQSNATDAVRFSNAAVFTLTP